MRSNHRIAFATTTTDDCAPCDTRFRHLAPPRLAPRKIKQFNTTLQWRPATASSQAGKKKDLTRLSTHVEVRFSVALPPPFTYAPRILVQGAAGLIMRSVTRAITRQFVSLLVADYQLWINGTRNTAEAVGKLV